MTTIEITPDREFLVACLCAAWCGTCRDYRPGFEALARQYPDADFLWLDVEDDAAWLGDFDVEDFPTLLIQRSGWVLFYGPMLPHLAHLQRTLDAFRAQSPEQSRDYAFGNEERRAWQEDCNLRALLREGK